MDKKETRGRPVLPDEDKVERNGLFKWQWGRIKKDARNRGMAGAQMLRKIVSDYYEMVDMAKHQYIPSKEEDLEFEELVKGK